MCLCVYVCANFFTSSLDSLLVHFQKFHNWVLCYSLTCFPSHDLFPSKHQGHNAISWKLLRIYDIYTNNTSYFIYMKIYIYMYLSYIYNIYIYKVSTLWHRIFFLLQINVYSVSASKYKQIFSHSASYDGEEQTWGRHSWTFLSRYEVRDTCVSKTLKWVLF